MSEIVDGMSGESSMVFGAELAAAVDERFAAAFGAHPQDPETSERLRGIVREIETFLLGHLERLESLVENAGPAVCADAEADPQTLDSSEDRRSQERRRAQEIERLKSEAAYLMDAWQRLESEQRKLLNRGEAGASSTLTSREDACCSHTAPNQRIRPEKDAFCPSTAVSDDEPLTAERAALQFQQMRRELQRHRLRR